MSAKWLIVAATPGEIKPFADFLAENAFRQYDATYLLEDKEISILVTGVGLTLTAYHLGVVFGKQTFDRVVNAGIAGAINREIPIGSVVEVASECFGDMGAESAGGAFIDIHQMGLIPPDLPPFQDGRLNNPRAGEAGLPIVKGLSVNKVHGFLPSITEMMIHFDADIETMEGAAFFYTCLSSAQPFCQIRAISNYVEPRDRSKWDIPGAVQALNRELIRLIRHTAP